MTSKNQLLLTNTLFKQNNCPLCYKFLTLIIWLFFLFRSYSC